MRLAIRFSLSVFAAMLFAPLALAAGVAQKSFATPEEGAVALFTAVKANDVAAIRAVLGPDGSKLIQSGDKVSDEQRRARFVAAYNESHRLALEGDAKAVLVTGKDDWPMPIPLVKSGKGWRFDTAAGKDEVLKRRIGRNELGAMQVCLSIVDAEREYVARDRDGDGLMEYAAKISSAPGKRDGLFWETRADEPASPLGPLVAAAAKEGYGKSGALPLSPYHGYYYRILTRQGKEAKGGELDYIAKGQLIGGFAVIAYPARYGASGVMTFIVNHEGIVLQKDLGPETAAVAAKIGAFNPDASWKPAKPATVSADAAK
jgi:hypothetical protein